jgi:histidine ammonia-lyase
MTSGSASSVVFDGAPLRIEDVTALSRRERPATLSTAAAFVTRIDRGAAFIDRLLKEDGVVYGVTTGYGDSCTVAVPSGAGPELPHAPVRVSRLRPRPAC